MAYTLDGLNYTPFQTVAVQDVDGSANVPVVVLDLPGFLRWRTTPTSESRSHLPRAWRNRREQPLRQRHRSGIALPPPPENTAPIFVAVADQTLDEFDSAQCATSRPWIPTCPHRPCSSPGGWTCGSDRQRDGVLWNGPPATAGPGVYDVRVRVTDNGILAKSSETTFKVTVNDVLPVTRIRINEVMSSTSKNPCRF